MTRSKTSERAPIVWIALGRQRVGKTALLNSAVQFFREAGNTVRVWNADQLNRSHSLSQFFPDAETVPEGDRSAVLDTLRAALLTPSVTSPG